MKLLQEQANGAAHFYAVASPGIMASTSRRRCWLQLGEIPMACVGAEHPCLLVDVVDGRNKLSELGVFAKHAPEHGDSPVQNFLDGIEVTSTSSKEGHCIRGKMGVRANVPCHRSNKFAHFG